MTTTQTQTAPPQHSSTDPDAPASDGRTDEASPTRTLPVDQVFETLMNSRRRQVLRYLQAADEAATVGELAEHVAAIENDTTVQQLSSQQRKRVYVGLYQSHLPKLDDADVVAYDDDRGTVELGPNAPQLERYLDVAGRPDGDDARPWYRYYLGAAGGGVGAFGLASVALNGALGAAATVSGLGVTVGVAALAVAHAQELV